MIEITYTSATKATVDLTAFTPNAVLHLYSSHTGSIQFDDETTSIILRGGAISGSISVLTLPKEVVQIDNTAISSYNKSLTIYCYALQPPILESNITLLGSSRIYVPLKVLNAYWIAPFWSGLNIVAIPEKVATRAEAAEIGEVSTLSESNKLVIYPMLSELNCLIKEIEYTHPASEYQTAISGKYRSVLLSDLEKYVLKYNFTLKPSPFSACSYFIDGVEYEASDVSKSYLPNTEIIIKVTPGIYTGMHYYDSNGELHDDGAGTYAYVGLIGITETPILLSSSYYTTIILTKDIITLANFDTSIEGDGYTGKDYGTISKRISFNVYPSVVENYTYPVEYLTDADKKINDILYTNLLVVNKNEGVWTRGYGYLHNLSCKTAGYYNLLLKDKDETTGTLDTTGTYYISYSQKNFSTLASMDFRFTLNPTSGSALYRAKCPYFSVANIGSVFNLSFTPPEGYIFVKYLINKCNTGCAISLSGSGYNSLNLDINGNYGDDIFNKLYGITYTNPQTKLIVPPFNFSVTPIIRKIT